MQKPENEELEREIHKMLYQIGKSSSYDVSKVIAGILAASFNGMGITQKELIYHLDLQHRTLQQSIFSFFLKWCHFLAGLDERKPGVDGRNEASVETAKLIMKALDNRTGLPFI